MHARRQTEINQPITTCITVYLFVSGSAMWRTDVLKKYPFDHKALTEDVDVSARALLDGHRIGFWPKARSGELAPLGYRALVSQRLRWFMGWEQVTHKYVCIMLATQCILNTSPSGPTLYSRLLV